jgi:3-oxoacyl-[acyl-carrier protein] reductase
MDLGLKGRRAIVTGGSKGIGKAIAAELGSEGVDVAICARGDGPLQATATELRKLGVRVFARAVDVTDGPGLAVFVEAAARDLGGLDILVNNAGSALPGAFEEVDEARWRADLDVKLFAAMRSWRWMKPSTRA